MSRENLLNSVEEERTEAEALAQQERDAVEPITQPPYVVLSEEMNPISFHSGLSGSLTKLSNGDDYLVAGTSNISLSTGSNGAITIDMDDVVYDNWKVGPSTVASGSAYTETILRDETNRGGLEIYRATDAAKSKLMSIKNYAFGSAGPPLPVISDEEGGLFIATPAGSTASSQNAKASNLIHIDSSGSLSNFDVAMNGSVYSLLLSGSGADKTLFVGGAFTKVGHSAPAGFAVDLATDEASDPFEVSTSHNISDMVVLSDGSIIIGGGFTRVKGITRNGLAKINPDGTLSTWNPGVQSLTSGYPHYVYSVVADEANDVLYIGGNFARVGDGYGSTTRSNLAAIKISDGTVTSWNPSAAYSGFQYAAYIRKMILDSSANRLYVGGFFSTLGNGGSATAVSSMGAISTVDGSRIDWSPNLTAGSTVFDMVLDPANSVIYAGGTFTSANGTTRNRLAAWSTTGTGLLTPTSWNPGANNTVYALAHDSANNKMYVGGAFYGLGGGTGATPRNYIGAVSTSDSGTVDPVWNPIAGSTVYGIALSGNNVYIGGSFTSIGGPTQYGLAKLSKADGVDTGGKLTWDYQPSTTGKVLIYSNKLYTVNTYTLQGGTGSSPLYFASRNRLFAIDANYRKNSNSIENKDTFLKPWNPGASSSVYSLDKDPVNPTIYIGGAFSRMGVNSDIPRQNIASVDSRGTGQVSDWFPYVNGACYGLAYDSSEQKAYVGGSFTRAGDSLTTRNYLVRFPVTSTSPSTITVQGGVDVPSLATISTLWPSSTGRINYGAGENGESGTSYRVINVSASPGSTVSMTFDISTVSSLDYLTIKNLDTGNFVTQNYYYGSGRVRFSSLPQGNYGIGVKSTSGASASYGWRLEGVTYDLPADSWNPGGADGTVYSIHVDSTSVYVGGRFETVGGAIRKRVAEISKSTGTATSWNPGLNMTANVIKKSGDSVYVGGDFTGLASSTTSGLLYNTVASPTNADGYIADLNLGTGSVYASVALSDGSFIIGGDFTQAGGQTRNGLAKFSAAGVLDATWDPNVYAASGMVVRAIEYNAVPIGVAGSLIYIGGTFSKIGGSGGTSRSNLAAISTTGAGEVDATWNPGCSGDVHALNLDTANSKIYVGGSFTAVDVSSSNTAMNTSDSPTTLHASPTTSTSATTPMSLTVPIPANSTITSTTISYDVTAYSEQQMSSGVTPTYSSGDGNTSYSASPTTSTVSSCPLTLNVTIPADATITGAFVEYSMTARNNGWLSEQRSYIRTSAGNESTIYTSTGNTTGTAIYKRALPMLVGYQGSNGTISVSLHAFRTYSSTGEATCSTLNNYVPNNTFKVTITYATHTSSTTSPSTGSTSHSVTPTTSTLSACPLTVDVSVPTGAKIVSADVSYSMTATGTGLISHQRSYVRCTSTGGIAESAIYSGVGAVAGTYSYSRGGLNIANGVTSSGTVRFELHSFRTSGGTGCNTTYNYVVPNTYRVQVNYLMPAKMSEQRSYVKCVSSGGASESSISSGVGNTAGIYYYNRSGLNIANSVSGGGNINFELHSFRTALGNGTGTTYQKTDNFSATVYYTTPVSLGGNLSGAYGASSTANRLGVVSTSGVGNAINWDPQITNGTVQALTRNDASSILYVGGTFNTGNCFGGTTRNYLGAVSTTATGLVAANATFNPVSTNGNVTGLVYDPLYSALYCAGRFTAIGGSTRYMIAALNSASGTAWTWAPVGSSSYYSSALDRKIFLDTTRNKVYFSNSIVTYGGGYIAGDGSPISSLACASRATISTGAATNVDWNPGFYGTVNTISVNSAGVLFAGLTYSSSNWKTVYPTDRVVKLSALTSTAPDVLEWGTVTSRQRDSVRGLYVGSAFGGEYVIVTSDDAKSSAAASAMTYSTSTTTLKPRYVVENDLLKMSYQLNVISTQTLAGNGNYIITLPQGWYIDTEKVTLGTVEGYYSDFSNATIVGIGSIRGNVVGGGGAWALIPFNRTQMVLVGKDPASNQVVVWGANAFPWTTTGGLKVHLTTCIPVKRNNLY